MKPVENAVKTAIDKVKDRTVFGFPCSHLIASFVLVLTLAVSALFPNEPEEAARSVTVLELPSEQTTHAPESEPEAYIAKPSLNEVKIKVKPGDNLSLIFNRAGLSDTAMMNFLAAAEEAKKLESIKPGHDLVFGLDNENEIHHLTYISSRLSSYSYTKADDAYVFSEEQRNPDIHTASRYGTIQSSLYVSGKNAGLDDKLIMELAEVFGWDIDFALDIRKGDSFRILYEEQFLDGEKLGNGAILSAEFINQGESFRAVRYVHTDGRIEYYTPEGKNMRKAFLRAPVDFRRISSSFNPRRLHPVTKVVRPHRGIDYAAKTGTPVWSSGDGRVIAAGYTKYNGNYVVIQHGNNVQTKYLHLHKRHVKKGQKIRQKQIIGTVGATGLVTGAHLHYEFLLNGVHRNPRTIVQKLPKAESISNELKADFLAQTQPLVAQLQKETNTQLAFNDEPSTPAAL